MSRVAPFRFLLDRARQCPRRVVLAEGEDPRVLRAAARLAAERIVDPLLVGTIERVNAAARAAGLDASQLSIVEPRAHGEDERLAAARKTLLARGLAPTEIDELLRTPLYFAAAMVRAGLAAGTLGGATHSSSHTIRAALRVIGPAAGARLVSSFFLMALREPTPGGDRILAFADCGLVARPDAAELADIARRTARSYAALVGETPRVALLSFSTHGSARDESSERVRRAAEILAAEAPELAADGELQVDAAIVPEVAARKAPGSPIGGRANVLIFPGLDAGNVGYKLVERLAGAQAVGPLLQGLALPANDLSRGCSAEDIVVAAAITSLQATMRA